MALRHLTTPPKADDFTPLQEHQEQTPTTFFGAKPVLYAHQSALTLVAPVGQLQTDPIFSKFSHNGSGHPGQDEQVRDVEIWVTSENLILFQATPTPTGVSIPYPTIALHATLKYQSTTDALLLNISLNDAETVNDFDDISILELTILPPNGQAECIKDIFTAMNTCADLHPDPDEDGEEGEEDSTAPGATGWITAENMDDYLDEEGNFKGLVYGEELGPGAGTVRTRDDGDEETRNGANGIDGEAHEEKYQRTG